MDPQPVVNWFRLGTFVSTVGAGILALDAASPELKTVATVVLLVVNAALLVFFPTTPSQSIASRVAKKLTK